jgi:hypothetical protein
MMELCLPFPYTFTVSAFGFEQVLRAVTDDWYLRRRVLYSDDYQQESLDQEPVQITLCSPNEIGGTLCPEGRGFESR